MKLNKILVAFLLLNSGLFNLYAQQKEEYLLHFKPESTKDKGKKIVLISGDEEYRSEEAMPMLAQLLTTRHGFETIVLFAINPDTKRVDPEFQKNIPGLNNLNDADLMIIATRFRELPDNQMKYINDYLAKGRPVIGLRTATHAFNFKKDSKSHYKQYAYNESSKEWYGGFGRLVLGETWVNHHGIHGKEGTRAFLNGLESNEHPILKGVKDIWVPSDVYGIKNKLDAATVLLFGQPTLGMKPDSAVNVAKSIMPIAWINEYQIPKGKTGLAFTTTMGASIDFANQDLRRLIVNACYWMLGNADQISEDSNVSPVGTFYPSMFGFGTYRKNLLPSDFITK